jgi:2-desacetyl-2-hydroxyethyl bacteriochlorophyllide A dehydrogenase
MRTIGIEYPARGQMRFYDLDRPGALKPTEVLICTRYSGVTNGTERHGLLGELVFDRFPGRHGYQHVGRVEAVGDAVEGWRVGDWVFYGAYVGHRGWHIVDTAPGTPLLITLPDEVDRMHCALFGVAGVAVRAVRRVRVSPAQNVWVVGQGLIGGFMAQAARACGARVTVTDVNAARLEIARQCGAHRTLNASGNDIFDRLEEEGPYDVILDGSGYKNLFLDIHQHNLLARRGVIGAIALRGETVFHWSTFHGREASIEVSCHFGVEDLTVLRHFVRERLIRIEPVISHAVSIDKAPEIYALLRDRPDTLLGVVFDWE